MNSKKFDNISYNRNRTVDNQQSQFIHDNNEYQPTSTFQNSFNVSGNSANLQNLSDYDDYNWNNAMKDNTPILQKPNFMYKQNTLDPNLNDNLNKETIWEYRLNIDSSDRDINIYPDPFEYIVTFGPVANSGVSSTATRTHVKAALKNENTYNNRKLNNTNDLSKESLINNINKIDKFEEQESLFDESKKNFIMEYNNNLKNIFNPNISRSFVNVKFIRLDNLVLPRFNVVKINYDWKLNDIKNSKCTIFIRDDYERFINNTILYDRYIPDPNVNGSLFFDRFIFVKIKELENNYNLATSTLGSNSFAVFPDRPTGLIYWRGSPYYAVRIYSDTTLGNIERLSFSFYDSWGNKITFNTNQIKYETDQIMNTDLLDPYKIKLEDFLSTVDGTKFIVNTFTEILKSIIVVNYDIKNRIPFYCSEFPPSKCVEVNYQQQPVPHNGQNIEIRFDEQQIYYNESVFILGNIYNEFDEFVTVEGFIKVPKETQDHGKIFISINDFIDNVIWFDFKDDYKNDKLIHNLTVLWERYKLYVFKILDKLKKEIINLPLAKYFQNHSMFVMGIFEQRLNTKISYRPNTTV
jgi:hypothetical protein